MDYAENNKLMEEDIDELKEFMFPLDDNRLKDFMMLSTEDQLNAISLGSFMLKEGKNRYISMKSGENLQLMQQLKTEYEEKILNKDLTVNKLREDIRRIKNGHVKEMSEISQEITEKTKARYQKHWNDKFDELNNQLEATKEQMKGLIDTRIEQNNKNNSQLLNMQQKAAQEKDEIRRGYEEKMDELRGKIEQIVILSSNSTKKGQEGEDWTYNELLRLFPEAMVEDTHAQGGRGDFIIRDKYVGMVDSKKFKGNVPKRDIIKFKADMENNNEYQYGLLCATDHGIAAKSDLLLEFVAGKPIVYIHKARNNPQKILMACNLCRLILKNMECFDVAKEENQLIIKEKTKSLVKIKKKMLKKVQDFSESMIELMDTQWNELDVVLKQINVKY
jgi:hypothetical protein